jgi:hypothetical protein
VLGAGLVLASQAAAAAEPTGAVQPHSLGLGDLYARPVGPKGLEYSDRAQALDGQRVCLNGFMVRQASPVPWSFLLSPVPLQLHEREYGLAEDLPPTSIHVFLPRNGPPVVPHRSGLHQVVGTLRLGPQEQADGRIAAARLEVGVADLPLFTFATQPVGAGGTNSPAGTNATVAVSDKHLPQPR